MSMPDESRFILAMYDIRGKQDYIYRSSRLKEIVGASLMIRDCFLDYLFPAAEKVMLKQDGKLVPGKGIYSYRVGKYKGDQKEDGKYFYKAPADTREDFTKAGFIAHLNEGYLGEVVYDGGGNFFVLFRDREVYREVNRKFYVKLLGATYSLKVLTSYITDIDFDNYRDDQRRLYEVHRKNEHSECAIPPVNALPIVQTDPKSFLPLAVKLSVNQAQGRKDDKVSLESKAKYDKYDSSRADRSKEGTRILDEMILEKGEDSHLAVIYIDGNSMGAKVQEATDGCVTYEESVRALRAFSAKIQREYIDEPMRAIDAYFEEKARNDGKAGAAGKYKRRFVIYAGDEITFICNAFMAYEIVREYFKALNPEDSPVNQTEVNSSCAGVAIFHSHAPYSEAYRIAEECCETGKRLMKEKGVKNACLMDFHYCQGAIGTSLEDIRAHEGTEELCIPWRLDHFGDNGSGSMETPGVDDVTDMASLLNQIARSSGKTLLTAAKAGEEEFCLKLERIKAHAADAEIREKLQQVMDQVRTDRSLVYRMMLVYDLWFRTGEEKKEAEGGAEE